jgi:zinc protease
LGRALPGSIPKRDTAAPPVRAATPLAGEPQRAEIADRVPVPRLFFGWPVATAPVAEGPALDTIVALLSGEGGALERQLVHGGVASKASCYFQELRLGSSFRCTITAATGRSAADVEHAFDAVVARLRSDGPTEAELKGAVASLQSATIRDLAALESRAGSLTQDLFLYGDASHWRRALTLEKALTPDAVRAAARRWLDGKRRVLVTVRPAKDSEKLVRHAEPPPVHLGSGTTTPVWSDPDPWRMSMPPLGAVHAFVPPAIHRVVLANGLPIYVVENHALPMVTVELLSVGGRGVNPPNKASAQLSAKLLLRGADARDADQLAAALRASGATLTATANADSLSLTLEGLRDELEPALNLLADVALRPRLDASELGRVRAEAMRHTTLASRDKILAPNTGPRVVSYGVERAYRAGPSFSTLSRTRSSQAPKASKFRLALPKVIWLGPL